MHYYEDDQLVDATSGIPGEVDVGAIYTMLDFLSSDTVRVVFSSSSFIETADAPANDTVLQ